LAVEGVAGVELRGWFDNGSLAALALVAQDAEVARTFLLEPKPDSQGKR